MRMRLAGRLLSPLLLALLLMGMDSDGDGIPDELEDANQNGVVDHGETDPHRVDTDGDGTPDARELELGTDPAHNGLIDFPEPMVFDMVRGLGAAQGELEINTLVQLPTDPFEVVWAPEVEVAVIDNFAIEIEAGFVDADFVGIKLGLQATLAMEEDGSVAHGLLGLVEYLPEGDAVETSLSYILGIRVAPAWSIVSLVGPALESHIGGDTEGGGLINLTLFWAPAPRWVVGSEQNAALFPGQHLFRWMPQVHYQIDRRFQLQAGAGYLFIDRRSSFEGAFRIILEL